MDIMSSTSSSDEDDDVPELPMDTLAILQEFYREQDEKIVEEKEGKIAENWQLSQFWYDDDTARTLAREVLDASDNGRICCLCAPTLYKKLREMKPDSCEIFLLEYDKRFAVFGTDFVFYDYHEPLNIPGYISEKSFDVVFADPPFLTEECFLKVSQTVKHLMKKKLLLCTGLRMRELVEELHGAKPCKFIPGHKSNLMNAFRCYANYDSKLNS